MYFSESRGVYQSARLQIIFVSKLHRMIWSDEQNVQIHFKITRLGLFMGYMGWHSCPSYLHSNRVIPGTLYQHCWWSSTPSGLYSPPEPFLSHSVRDTLPTLPIAHAVQNKPPSLAAAWLQQLWCAFRPVEINSKLFPGFKYNHSMPKLPNFR